MSLKHELIKLGSTNPELRPHIRKVLAGCEKLPEGGMRDNCEEKKEEAGDKKEASGGSKTANDGMTILMLLIGGRKAYYDAGHAIEEKDTQMGNLFSQVAGSLGDSLDITQNQWQAISRLKQVVENASRWDSAMIRNNVSKAADLAGVRLPSYMFASDKSSADQVQVPEWLSSAFKELDDDYDNTLMAMKPISYAIANGKPVSKAMVTRLEEATADDQQFIDDNGFATNKHKAGNQLFKKIKAWAEKSA